MSYVLSLFLLESPSWKAVRMCTGEGDYYYSILASWSYGVRARDPASLMAVKFRGCREDDHDRQAERRGRGHHRFA